MRAINEITIDLQHLKVLHLSVNHVLTLIKIYFSANKQFFDYNINDEDIKFLHDNKYIVVYSESSIKYNLREKGDIILSKMVGFKKEPQQLILSTVNPIQDKITLFENQVKTFREKFNGLRVGSMGQLSSVRSKLKRWMKSNPEITFKEILLATDCYIESLNGNYNYLQRADYFIYKQNQRKEEDSRLSIFVDESKKEPVNSDWGSEIK